MIKRIILYLLSVSFLFTSFVATASNSQIPDCEKLVVKNTKPGMTMAARAICHHIRYNALMKGMTVPAYLAKYGRSEISTFKHDALTTYKSFTPSDGAQLALSPQGHAAMCQGLCASIQVIQAIPVIGWFIAIGLIAVAIAEKCDNCGGYQPV